MAENRVRVRYAPSPTGEPHIGNIHTAFFNWLFARRNKGAFIVRIEDTDQKRLVPTAPESILESLRWLGMTWDEGPDVGGAYGPYFQSQRLDMYQYYARKLVEDGVAYPCYCSEKRLEQMRAEQQARKVPPGYDRRCRDLTPAERAAKEAEGITPVVRFKMPDDGETSYHDLVYGDISVKNATLDDLVLLKSDGFPTYHLANVIDDHLMEISHIMRANEWLPSVPRHVLLYKALGWQPPVYAHLPMLLGPDRSKLSKRHGATSVLAYRDMGYLVESMQNFMALLGWAYDDKTEIFTLQQLIEYFSLEKVSPAPSIFSVEKLDWLNGHYIRTLSAGELGKRALPFILKDLRAAGGDESKWPVESVAALAEQFMPIVQERIKRLTDVWPLVDFFFADEVAYDRALLLGKGMTDASVAAVLKAAQSSLLALDAWQAPAMEAALRPLAEQLGLKVGQFFGVLRVAITGKQVTPPLLESMVILGRAVSLARLQKALDMMAGA
jgi:glutamyl-tRNA synthetase